MQTKRTSYHRSMHDHLPLVLAQKDVLESVSPVLPWPLNLSESSSALLPLSFPQIMLGFHYHDKTLCLLIY